MLHFLRPPICFLLFALPFGSLVCRLALDTSPTLHTDGRLAAPSNLRFRGGPIYRPNVDRVPSNESAGRGAWAGDRVDIASEAAQRQEQALIGNVCKHVTKQVVEYIKEVYGANDCMS